MIMPAIITALVPAAAPMSEHSAVIMPTTITALVPAATPVEEHSV